MLPRSRAAIPSSFRIAVVLTACFGAVAPGAVAAQSSSLAAWTAMMLSPAGGLAPIPIVVDTSVGGSSTQIAPRAGRWQIDSTDAIHSVFGLTLSHRLSPSGAAGEATLGYVRVACDFCKHWVFGGLDAQTAIRTISATRVGTRVA